MLNFSVLLIFLLLRGTTGSEVEMVGKDVIKSIMENKDKGEVRELNKHRAEDMEFQMLDEKWRLLSNKNNYSMRVVPKEWLLTTNKNKNITFNSSQVEEILAQKIKKLIKSHDVWDFTTRRPLLSKSFPSERGLEIQLAKVTISELKKDKVKMMLKATNFTRGQEKDVGWYPGGNESLRDQFFEQWKAYYQCLNKKDSFTPKAYYAFPGESIKLDCLTCLRPGGGQEVTWTSATVRTKYREENVDLLRKRAAFHGSNRVDFSDDGLSLYIFNVNEKDAGNYSCKQSNTLVALHLVQVADDGESIEKVWPPASNRKPHGAPDIALPNFGVKVYTKWRNWTSCSRCNRVGKRFKLGVCTVLATNIFKKAPAILTLFKEGIPCKSKLLPGAIQTHPNVAFRKSEVIEGFCKKPCEEQEKFVVRDKQGKIVEEADNAKGVYSMLQKLPKLPPPPRRKILFLKQWDTAHIRCPGNVLSDAPVRWYIDEQPIHFNGTRVYVTSTHLLVIEDLGLSDSTLYSCWQGSRLVGTVRLEVSQPIRLTFSQQISAISMILIVATFVLVFGRAFCNALHAAK